MAQTQQVSTTDPAASIVTIRGLLRRGECLAAYDSAVAATGEVVEGSIAALEIAYLRTLALARSGGAHRAAAEAAALTAVAPWDELPQGLGEDLMAISARIEKDAAWATPAVDRREPLATAAAAYEAVFARFGRSYACVNASTLWRLAGGVEHARALAAQALAMVDGEQRADASAPYWAWATRAEARLVLGDLGGATDALAEADRHGGGDLGARAATRRQLRHLCEGTEVDPAPILAALPQPEVLHYCGHMVSPHDMPGRFPAHQEQAVAAQIREVLSRRPVGFVHGSLASGADILVAEAALEAGAELHLVLPFEHDEFVAISVEPGGPGWVERFERCCAMAASMTVASDSAYGGDDVLFAYASRISMGQVRNRAASLDADIWQLAISDGDPNAGVAGTAHDMEVWRRSGGHTEVISVSSNAPVRSTQADTRSRREIRSILFGDFKGFSRLRDENFDAFLETVMAPIGAVLDGYGADVIIRNTWGDGLFVVMTGAASGARCALELQGCVESMDLQGAGLPADMGLRLGGHVAPVISVQDPVLHRPSMMGRELTRAARIEPRTPTGKVYVTTAFAALLALEPGCEITPEYVGHLTTAKNFETTAMYLLQR